ncbi:quinone oxidoreductase [Phyllosticta capitalensis]|uniref:quinone oxidoreductase n=1 Tax=Phyllosticta capitalensis TaxID=121624 RepID=UPI00312F1D96
MRGIQVSKYVKEPSELRVTNNIPEPVPKPDEYGVEVRSFAANFFDILQVQGKYQFQPPFPWTAGVEFSGVVVRVPTAPADGRAPQFNVGDRVFGGNQGACAERVALSEDKLFPVPQGWSFADAAGLWVTAPTSYGGLVLRGELKKGDFVLVHAAAGGVGLAAVQVAKAFGATVIATAGTPRKLEVAKSFGADHVLDYRQADWPEQVKKLTPNGRGVDIVYDSVGLIEKSTKCIAWKGRILVIGFAGGIIEKIPANRLLLKNCSVVGVFWGGMIAREPQVGVDTWKGIFELINSGKYRGTLFTDKEYRGFESVAEALTDLGRRDTWGKVVVNVGEEGRSRI